LFDFLKKIKKNADDFNKKIEEKLDVERQANHLKIIESEKNCKKRYVEIISSPEKLNKLYQNIDIQWNFVQGKISESQYKQKMNEHKKAIDNMLFELNEDNIDCDKLWKLVSSRIGNKK